MNKTQLGRTLKIAVGITMLALLLSGESGAATITVNASGGADYTKIQDAINAASAGDTILVYSGAYYESINVNKQLTLQGIGMPEVIANDIENAFTLATNGITLEGFTAIGNFGIHAISNNNTVSGNNVSNNRNSGIVLDSSSNNMLSNNNVSNNMGAGIVLDSSNNNTLSNNNVSNNMGAGIPLDSSRNNMLNNNIALNNNFDGIYLFYSSNNTLTNNRASNNHRNGIYLLSSSNSNKLSNNNASLNSNGINLDYSSNNMLSNNNVSNNMGAGIYLYYSSNNNTLSGNNASNNSYGISLLYSRNDTIYNNIFINNNNFESSASVNSWNATKTSGSNIIGGSYIAGNFWANPNGTGFSQTCTDAVSDGICDSSFTLDSSNIDYLPLSMNIQTLKTAMKTNRTPGFEGILAGGALILMILVKRKSWYKR